MRIAIISDLHANLEALESFAETWDELWVLGDLVNYGPTRARLSSGLPLGPRWWFGVTMTMPRDAVKIPAAQHGIARWLKPRESSQRPY
jgi:calcineurin-like phosphoesterase family protein